MKQDTIIMIAFLCGIIYLGTALLINTSKSCDVNIDYDVSVDSNSTGITPSISEVKLACYKLCVDELRANDYKLKMCLDKCEKL